jgi:hypothetical protein
VETKQETLFTSNTLKVSIEQIDLLCFLTIPRPDLCGWAGVTEEYNMMNFVLKQVDFCGEWGGNNRSMGCDGVCSSKLRIDSCGVCGGNDSALDCNGVCQTPGTVHLSTCTGDELSWLWVLAGIVFVIFGIGPIVLWFCLTHRRPKRDSGGGSDDDNVGEGVSGGGGGGHEDKEGGDDKYGCGGDGGGGSWQDGGGDSSDGRRGYYGSNRVYPDLELAGPSTSNAEFQKDGKAVVGTNDLHGDFTKSTGSAPAQSTPNSAQNHRAPEAEEARYDLRPRACKTSTGPQAGCAAPLREVIAEQPQTSLRYQRPSTAVSPGAKRQDQTSNSQRPSTAPWSERGDPRSAAVARDEGTRNTGIETTKLAWGQDHAESCDDSNLRQAPKGRHEDRSRGEDMPSNDGEECSEGKPSEKENRNTDSLTLQPDAIGGWCT